MRFDNQNRYLSKDECLEYFINLDGTIKATFSAPKVGYYTYDRPSLLSCNDCDFFEMEVLRKFYINMSRVVEFEFVAYPESFKRDDEKVPVGLHYHAVIKSENDSKFLKVAPRKFQNVLKSAYPAHLCQSMPNNALWLEPLDDKNFEPRSYENYCIKQYEADKRIVLSDDFDKRTQHPIDLSLSREAQARSVLPTI